MRGEENTDAFLQDRELVRHQSQGLCSPLGCSEGDPEAGGQLQRPGLARASLWEEIKVKAPCFCPVAEASIVWLTRLQLEKERGSSWRSFS